jgi:hypothetical protein
MFSELCRGDDAPAARPAHNLLVGSLSVAERWYGAQIVLQCSNDFACDV